MSFKTPLKQANQLSIFDKHYGSQYSIGTTSTIKKQLNYQQVEDTIKKNKSVTFQNSQNNVSSTIDDDTHMRISKIMNPQSTYKNMSSNGFLAKNKPENENSKINQALSDILKNADDKKYQIYQQQVDRQKQSISHHYLQQRSQCRKQHCPNDKACSLKYQNVQNELSLQKNMQNSSELKINKPRKRDLEEYNFEQQQKEIVKDQFRIPLCSATDNLKTPEKKKDNKQEYIDENISEQEIQYSLLNNARSISSKTFLKIQACMKPHPVLMNYCLSFIVIYKDHLQISDQKWKKLENNWREIQDVFQHHAPLIQALDSIGSLIQQQRIQEDNLQKSTEYIERTKFLVDSIKDTNMFIEIILPLDNFIKSCSRAIRFYNKKWNMSDSKPSIQQKQENQNSFNRLDQIMLLKQNKQSVQQKIQNNDFARRNTFSNLNQQKVDQFDPNNNLGEFSPDLSPIQHLNFQRAHEADYAQEQQMEKLNDQRQERKHHKTHKRTQSENLEQYYQPLSERKEYKVTQPLDKLQLDYYKKIKKYIKRMEEIEKIKDEIWNL